MLTISVGEETNTSYETDFEMEPPRMDKEGFPVRNLE